MIDNRRDSSIDFAKALGIIAVVLGHTAFPYKNYLYQFHLPLFFFISGMVWNEKKIEQPRKYLMNKLKGLYYPFIKYEFLFLILHNTFSALGLYSVYSNVQLYYSIKDTVIQGIKILTMGGGEQLAGPLWFLISSFEIVLIFPILYLICNRIIKNPIYKSWMLLILGLLFYFIGCYTDFPRLLSRSLIGLMFFTFGYVFKEYRSKISMSFWGCIFSIFSIIICGRYNEVDISKLQITYKPLLIFSGLAGVYVGLYLGECMKYGKNKMISGINRLICNIGTNTIYILIFHCVSFKLVMYIEWLIYKYDYDLLGTFPVYTVSMWSILPLVLVGIAIPLILKKMNCFLYAYILTKREKNG